MPKIKVANVNTGCISRDSVRGTTEVRGSLNQYQALMAVHKDITAKTTKT